MCFRSSSDPLKCPPSRPAGDDDRVLAARERAGDVRIADRVETQLDQIGVRHLSRLRRRSAVVSAVTVTQTRVLVTSHQSSVTSRQSHQKKSLSNREAEEVSNRSRL
jgi:hypothetical protein